ncbi:hypothetical protein MRB53_006334 [Persea americana]|uniref:Uncharacterized protein n=1 Tax=Persea americana TaxID=3435 RepID=A0ACC2MGU7_PERAE|nr:hypothetical protein MRB53_006334 [Persea americana]
MSSLVYGTKGIVDYTNCDDMKYVIRKLDDFNFRNAFSRPYIRISFAVGRRRSRVEASACVEYLKWFCNGRSSFGASNPSSPAHEGMNPCSHLKPCR